MPPRVPTATCAAQFGRSGDSEVLEVSAMLAPHVTALASGSEAVELP